MSVYQEERPLSDLFRDLMNEAKILIQQEMQLLKLEMSQKAKQAGKDVGFIAVGGALAYAGLLGLLYAAILALALIIPAWASALIVGLAVVGIGYALIQKGISDLKTMDPAPQKTIDSLKETKQWTTNVLN
ncbi:phage holin family protein [Candidatus Nitrospira allomarina]|uniref:Phage holin family protein n=1 Tax=Candidatus Nitrospira allomarina TaxID=3020900 RepID=A0AA96JQM7_9BACT|nr:phage holin family protein [Candidatus Nitrospira allomarina]WNM56607.1 phage holin family protein [Candidatus Nitrospira allomarina]